MESTDATMTRMYEPPVLPDGPALCVLASGSAGNCSVLLLGDGVTQRRRACLIDLGLSPRKTWRLLGTLGIEPHQIDSVILTHLDADHLHRGWLRPGAANTMPGHVCVRAHHTHARELARTPLAERGTLGRPKLAAFDDGFSLAGDGGGGCRVYMASHDEEGVSVFRFELVGGSLGFATDVGCVTAELIEHLTGVDVLAIESNYCPRMQEASGRPEFLKQRITGGSGHLSNFQALTAIGHIEPKLHVVLLHLSRDCNCPEVVAQMHEGADYAWTITDQHEPTRWIGVGAGHAVLRDVKPTAIAVGL